VETAVLPQIDEILDVLKNGKWHDIREISEKTHLRERKVEMITGFLAQYHFIELNRKERKTRLTQPLQEFLRRVQELEDKEKVRAR